MASGARFRRGECFYDDVAAMRADVDSYLVHGVVRLATGEAPPRPLELFPFQLRLPDGQVLDVRGEVIAAGVCPLIKIADWKPAYREAVLAASRSTTGVGEQHIRSSTDVPPMMRAPADQAPTLPSSSFGGQIENPTDLATLRALPLRPDARVRQLSERPNVCTLLRWLAACQASGTLAIIGPRRIEMKYAGGKIEIAERERTAVADALLWPTATFEFQSDSNRSSFMGGVGSWIVVVGMVKRFVREIPVHVLKESLPATKAPRFDSRGARLLSVLALSPAETRFVGSRLDGSGALADLMIAAGLSDIAVLRLLTLLDLITLISWEAPRAKEVVDEDPIQDLYERRVRGDFFRAVGGHYSDSPSRLRSAYEAMRVAHRPGSEAHQRSPEYAAKIFALAERAWATVGERKTRQRYRQEVMQLSVEGLADLLFEQAKMDLLRGEIGHARELVEEAIDLFPAPQYLAMLDQIRQAKLK